MFIMCKNKRLNQKIWSLLLTCIVMYMSTVPVYATEYSEYTSATNHGQIGAVDIILHQTFPKEQVTIVPNQIVPFESSVENKGKPAWIRVKLVYPKTYKTDDKSVVSENSLAVSENSLEKLDDSLISFADEKWTKIGSYYYLTEYADTGDIIPFTKSITFPSDWDNNMIKATMDVEFTAEAIQEKNFKPDFDSNDPWHGAVIEAFDSDNYHLKSDNIEQFSIVYKNGVEGLVHLNDDFFENWNELMPGDELDGAAQIANHMNIPVKIYFEMKNEGKSELLNEISITIKNDDEIIYDGPLSGEIEPAVMLYEYRPNDDTEFSYHISIPGNLNNDYALSDFKVIWTFSVEEVIPEKSIDHIVEIIKTDDHNLMTAINAFGLVMSIVLLIYVWKMYFKNRRKGGTNNA